MNVIKANQNPRRYNKFITEESKNGKHLIEFYFKIPKFDEIVSILDELIQYLKVIQIAEVQQTISKLLFITTCLIYLDCEEYVNKCFKWRMHKIHKNKMVVKFIRSKKPYERYQIDLFDISKEWNSTNNSPYLLTCVDHFSKYAWAIPIKNKEE